MSVNKDVVRDCTESKRNRRKKRKKQNILYDLVNQYLEFDCKSIFGVKRAEIPKIIFNSISKTRRIRENKNK